MGARGLDRWREGRSVRVASREGKQSGIACLHACVHFVRASKGRSEKREFPCDGPPIWSQSVHGREERERRKRVDVAATRRTAFLAVLSPHASSHACLTRDSPATPISSRGPSRTASVSRRARYALGVRGPRSQSDRHRWGEPGGSSLASHRMSTSGPIERLAVARRKTTEQGHLPRAHGDGHSGQVQQRRSYAQGREGRAGREGSGEEGGEGERRGGRVFVGDLGLCGC